MPTNRTCIISSLIVVVGFAIDIEDGGASNPPHLNPHAHTPTPRCPCCCPVTLCCAVRTENFTVEDLGEQIGLLLNPFFKIVFCIGLYAAAFSSAITCPLAAALWCVHSPQLTMKLSLTSVQCLTAFSCSMATR